MAIAAAAPRRDTQSAPRPSCPPSSSCTGFRADLRRRAARRRRRERRARRRWPRRLLRRRGGAEGQASSTPLPHHFPSAGRRRSGRGEEASRRAARPERAQFNNQFIRPTRTAGLDGPWPTGRLRSERVEAGAAPGHGGRSLAEIALCASPTHDLPRRRAGSARGGPSTSACSRAGGTHVTSDYAGRLRPFAAEDHRRLARRADSERAGFRPVSRSSFHRSALGGDGGCPCRARHVSSSASPASRPRRGRDGRRPGAACRWAWA